MNCLVSNMDEGWLVGLMMLGFVIMEMFLYVSF